MKRIMKINSYTNNYNQNFKAIKVATTKNVVNNIETTIDLYKLQNDDKNFIKNLKESININELYPKLVKDLKDRWQKVLIYCLEKAIDSKHITYIAVNENKPCGIMTIIKDSPFYLDGICTIPTGINKKVNFTGKTLFYQLFKDSSETGSRGICLDAVNDGAFDPIKKYSKLGFIITPSTSNYTKMYCNKYKVLEQYKLLSKEIQYEECSAQKENLNIFLN